MLDFVSCRYGSWLARGLLLEQAGRALINWPGRPPYESEIGVYVGPDAGRYIWCRLPAGTFNGPNALRQEGIQVRGRLSDGRRIEAQNCSSANFTYHADSSGSAAWIVLQLERSDLLLTTTPLHAGPCQVAWTLVNAIFDGDRLPTDFPPEQPVRRDTVLFSSGSRSWTLRLLPEFGDTDRDYLSNGVVACLPTAQLRTDLATISDYPEVADEAWAIGRLLSLVSGSSIGGAACRASQDGSLSIESFSMWTRSGTAAQYRDHALIVNGDLLSDSLSVFLTTCIPSYKLLGEPLSLSVVIGFLEQARSSQAVEVRIALAILAIETLTHQLCLDDGLTEDQIDKMNIETKLNRFRKASRSKYHMPFIDSRFSGETRKTVRNPLMHSGQISSLSGEEKYNWSRDLYSLAFRMLLFLLGYQGRWLDPSQDYVPAEAPKRI